MKKWFKEKMQGFWRIAQVDTSLSCMSMTTVIEYEFDINNKEEFSNLSSRFIYNKPDIISVQEKSNYFVSYNEYAFLRKDKITLLEDEDEMIKQHLFYFCKYNYKFFTPIHNDLTRVGFIGLEFFIKGISDHAIKVKEDVREKDIEFYDNNIEVIDNKIVKFKGVVLYNENHGWIDVKKKYMKLELIAMAHMVAEKAMATSLDIEYIEELVDDFEGYLSKHDLLKKYDFINFNKF